jgi:hypothetical protein
MVMRAIVLLRSAMLITLVSIYPASDALAYCSEPSAPSCASRYGEFDDEWEFDRCKGEMESYRDDVERFLKCNNDEAEEALRKARSDNQDALSEYNDTVESFNRRARGG